MKNLTIVLIALALIVLGCGYELTKKESPAVSPTPAANLATGPDANSGDEDKLELEKKVAELEKRKLEEKIEKLEKEVAAAEKKPTPKAKAKPKAAKPRPTELEMGYMRVNSPGDGWLALRSSPNSSSRLLRKIPHGTVVQVDYCGNRVRSGRLRGRWCEVVYRGTRGWSFDYYLKR